MDYKTYTAEDFALDDSFRSYVLNNDEQAHAFWKEWILENPDKHDEILLAAKMHKTLTFKGIAVPESKIDSIIESINAQLGQGETVRVKERNTLLRRPVYSVAAVLALLLTAAFIITLFNKTPEVSHVQKVSYITKTIPNGQKLTVSLPDSTIVKLNSGSTFRYPDEFSDTLREVFLEGEGFFEVSKDTGKPFIIHSANVDTRVLGTSFNISAYESEDDLKVAVATGRVEVSLASDQAQSEVLIPYQMFVYNKKNKTTTKAEDISLEEILAWKEGRLMFKNATHHQILRKLERWYGVEFEVKKRMNIGEGYTAKFKPNLSLEKTLERMQYSLKFQYNIIDNKVLLY